MQGDANAQTEDRHSLEDRMSIELNHAIMHVKVVVEEDFDLILARSPARRIVYPPDRHRDAPTRPVTCVLPRADWGPDVCVAQVPVIG